MCHYLAIALDPPAIMLALLSAFLWFRSATIAVPSILASQDDLDRIPDLVAALRRQSRWNKWAAITTGVVIAMGAAGQAVRLIGMNLTLRKTGLGRENDYVVILNERDVARTYRNDHTPQGQHWAWSVYAFGRQDGSMRGTAATLDDAKRELRTSIERCVAEGRKDHRDHPNYQGQGESRRA